MAGFRNLRKVPSLRTIVARRRKRIRYTDFKAAKPVRVSPVLSGAKLKDKI
jgi:hypothetical protein